MECSYLGLDIGKSKIHAALLMGDRAAKRKVVCNDESGHQELLTWLQRQGVKQLCVCLEATSTYGHAIARLLHQQGYQVSLSNPKAVQAYCQSRMSRTKTDAVDANLIAQYCRDLHPHPWTPPAPEVEQLQQMARRLQALDQMIAQEKNRLETASDALSTDINSHIAFMEQQQVRLRQQMQAHIDQHGDLKQQQQLLDSIPGIAQDTAARILGELGHWQTFGSARQLAAYAGVTPQEKTSGTSVHGKPRLCKLGNARLRKLLFFPALTLLRWNKSIQQWRAALLQRGKTKKQVVGAVMHKIIRWVFAVLHSHKPFDPALAFPTQSA
jgi:transposase